jgi:DNA-binding response OmpR family regulator
LEGPWRDVLHAAFHAKSDHIDSLHRPARDADDYVVKPFSAREVAARIRAVLRRVDAEGPATRDGPLEVGPVRLDPDRRSASVDGRDLELTRKEFELLELLCGRRATSFRASA